jgi:hypothetical protein
MQSEHTIAYTAAIKDTIEVNYIAFIHLIL